MFSSSSRCTFSRSSTRNLLSLAVASERTSSNCCCVRFHSSCALFKAASILSSSSSINFISACNSTRKDCSFLICAWASPICSWNSLHWFRRSSSSWESASSLFRSNCISALVASSSSSRSSNSCSYSFFISSSCTLKLCFCCFNSSSTDSRTCFSSLIRSRACWSDCWASSLNWSYCSVKSVSFNFKRSVFKQSSACALAWDRLSNCFATSFSRIATTCFSASIRRCCSLSSSRFASSVSSLAALTFSFNSDTCCISSAVWRSCCLEAGEATLASAGEFSLLFVPSSSKTSSCCSGMWFLSLFRILINIWYCSSADFCPASLANCIIWTSSFSRCLHSFWNFRSTEDSCVSLACNCRRSMAISRSAPLRNPCSVCFFCATSLTSTSFAAIIFFNLTNCFSAASRSCRSRFSASSVLANSASCSCSNRLNFINWWLALASNDDSPLYNSSAFMASKLAIWIAFRRHVNSVITSLCDWLVLFGWMERTLLTSVRTCGMDRSSVLLLLWLLLPSLETDWESSLGPFLRNWRGRRRCCCCCCCRCCCSRCCCCWCSWCFCGPWLGAATGDFPGGWGAGDAGDVNALNIPLVDEGF